MQKLHTFFSKNISLYAIFDDQRFSDTLLMCFEYSPKFFFFFFFFFFACLTYSFLELQYYKSVYILYATPPKCFETLPMFLSSSEDVHVPWV